MYNIKNEQFEGPLDLLLSLIEKEQLDVTQISLAKITGTYLEIINEINGSSSELADFLVIAAKLLYIKSRNLIPSTVNDEEEAEIEDLETRLKEYQKIKAAAKHLEEVLAEEGRSYTRQAKNDQIIAFEPPNNIDKGGLFAIFQEIINKIQEETPTQKEIKHEIKITLSEKREHILTFLKKNKKVSFRKALAGVGSKTEVIITFLAILEMIKQKEIKVEQNNNFSDFTIISVK